MNPSREQILAKVKEIMVELFELDGDAIRMESHLKDDLGLDSIDAIDLIVGLQTYVGQRLQPEDFKGVRTIADLISAAEITLQQIQNKNQV